MYIAIAGFYGSWQLYGGRRRRGKWRESFESDSAVAS